MAILKCKMCGGDLNVTEGQKVVECEYCGSKQTIIDPNDEKKINLTNRANRLRINSEFDKAASIYEQIIAEFPEEAEAYWGLCLCNYGIEYVDDPLTANKIPTCHRASFDKMRKDENYELALENADMSQRIVYEDQAKEIDRIMGEILSISRDEQPYDIFICYKETDNVGSRTPDSVLAQDIYDALTQKGYRVFFSRITLEDKLGTMYEPHIFSALNSAKVMLVIGTDYEYMNAVWVKNEWSRFLKLIAKDKSRVLIPCYKDMDPYDMPDEFKPFQSQDCSKIGFMQDLTHGIDKLFGKSNSANSQQPQQTSQASAPGVSSLLERAFMFLEDKDWNSANEYAEKVLDIEPKNAQAYLVKLLVDFKLTNKSELKNQPQPFSNNSNFEKITRFGDSSIIDELKSYINYIIDRNNKAKLEAEKKAEEERIAKEKAYQEKISNVEKIIEYAKLNDDSLKKEINSKIKNLNEQKDALLSKKENFINAPVEIEELKTTNENLKSQIKSFEAERSNLGLFAGSKKRELDSKISDAILNIETNNRSIDNLYEFLNKEDSVDFIDLKISEIDKELLNSQAELNDFNSKSDDFKNIDELLPLLEDNDVFDYFINDNSKVDLLKNCKKTYDYICKLGTLKIKIIFDLPFTFGKYVGSSLRWNVLSKYKERALLICDSVIDAVPYNKSRIEVTWENCYLRNWLNNSFYYSSFSEREKSIIKTTTQKNGDNTSFRTRGGNDTQDNIFLLSIEEAENYFLSDEHRKCKATDVAKHAGLYIANDGNAPWWLRSPGFDNTYAACVLDSGAIGYDGSYVDNDDEDNDPELDLNFNFGGVRPAMWISLE